MNSVIKAMSAILRKRESALFLVILVGCTLVSSVAPNFLTLVNIEGIGVGLTLEGIIVVGMVILLVSGGFDLSVGATMAFTGVVAGLMMKAGLPVPLAIVASLVCAAVVGVANGFLVTKANLNPLITTLGMMMAVRGLMLILSQGRAVLDLPSDFKIIGQGEVFGVQFPILILLVLVFLGDRLLRTTKFMRQSYYVGNNESAARLNGINVDAVKITNYCVSALMAGIAGLLITARFGSASVTIGDNTALNVITAAIIGGASLNGGEGSVLGAFLGAVFMQILANVLNLTDINIYWHNFITGAILILAVLIDSFNEKKKAGVSKK